MAARASLRKTLRSVPAFQAMSRQQLNDAISLMSRKEYEAGTVLWRAGARLSFFGIVEKGGITIDYRRNGAQPHSIELQAGSVLDLAQLLADARPSSVSAHVMTDTTLYTLQEEQLAVLSRGASANTRSAVPAGRFRAAGWSTAWWLAVALLAFLLMLPDLVGSLSRLFYLLSSQPDSDADSAETLRWINAALLLDPESAIAHNRAGYAFFQVQRMKEAEEAFSHAVGLDESSAPALNNLAVTHFVRGREDQARSLFTRAIEIDPNSAASRYNEGLGLVNSGDLTQAIQAFHQATWIEPEWAPPYHYLSFSYLQLGDYQSAEEVAREAARLDPDQECGHLSLAIALYRQGKNREAWPAIRRALLLQPNDLNAQFYEALILREQGMPWLALRLMERLLDSAKRPDQRERIQREIGAVSDSVPQFFWATR